MKTARWKSRLKLGAIVLLIAGAFFLGRKFAKDETPGETKAAPSMEPAGAHEDHEAESTIWTCSMHPQIQLPNPGQCPICGIPLIPLRAGPATPDAGDRNERRLVMTEADKKLAEIVTALVERKFVEAEIRMVGKVDYDETQVRTISAWVGGRVDRLYVDYTGVPVKKGDHLAEIYSPDLLLAQEELLQAHRWARSPVSKRSDLLRPSDLRRLESAREKLRLWGLAEEQVDEIIARGHSEDHVTISSPSTGIVIHKAVSEGQYVETGSPLYTVADLDRLWVRLDAYESDLAWLHYGQPVEIETEAFPGQKFDGAISFIDPVVDDRTRTVKIRVNVPNPDGKLKPGMFVHATVTSKIARGGKVMDPMLAGKWIASMHPEIVRDEPGDCPICGMALVRAEDLGYVRADDEAAMPIVVPASAVLKTGKRAVVYIEDIRNGQLAYEGREIVLGPRAGDYYLVAEGLAEGERVVVNGNFKIDSALQILAKPSMMNSDPGARPAIGHVHGQGATPAGSFDPTPERKIDRKPDHSGHPMPDVLSKGDGASREQADRAQSAPTSRPAAQPTSRPADDSHKEHVHEH